MARRHGSAGGSSSGPEQYPLFVTDVPFHETARKRYLNYAMSVITARALPDVRDGLKPVQRRILYTMAHELKLSPATKTLKCARIVGEVLGKFHPHGDVAVYEALVRMAQDFSLRHPLVDGQGNFGSIDGDGAAAYRYTEARLSPISMELLDELPKETVDLRPTYDGSHSEPVVLPARYPNLLVNGATGIAVGMATNIPPHNLAEVIEAAEALVDDRELTTNDLMKWVKGPDFPTGGQLLESKNDLRRIYEEGQGSVRTRGEWKLEEEGRSRRIIVTSIPYMVQKNSIVEAIGAIVASKKVPQMVDVRDESTTDIRIVIEIRKESDPELVMSFLYKHTALQTSFGVNLTCLVPGEEGGPTTPARLDLKSLLSHFLDFRHRTIVRRFEHDLRLLRERIHILEGFEKIFDALDEAIRIIRKSDGKADAAKKLMARFDLDFAQAEAILELKLYRLARLEMEAIRAELADKRAAAQRIEEILASPAKLRSILKGELATLRIKYGQKRRTRIGGRAAETTEYDEEAFILDEDAWVLLSRDGWVKRVGRLGELDKVRMRPEDELLAVAPGATKASVAFFTNFGSAYTVRINDIPPGRGYGEPIQKLFKFADGERAISALSFDPRVNAELASPEGNAETPPPRHLFAATSAGLALRASLEPFVEPSTRAGRKFARLREGEEVVSIHVVSGEERIVVAAKSGHVAIFPAWEIPFLSGPGRGVIAIKIDDDDRLMGAVPSRERDEGFRVVSAGGKLFDVNPRSHRVGSRGGRGIPLVRKGGFDRIELPPMAVPELPKSETGAPDNGLGGEEDGDE
jgi:DNA gyrase subunit A